MIIKLDDKLYIDTTDKKIDHNFETIENKLGNKAKFLMMMKQYGFNVPDGIVLDSDFYDQVLQSAGIDKKIESILGKLNIDNIVITSQKIIKLFEAVTIETHIQNTLSEYIKPNTKYAVRSSGTKEDLGDYSFAGQYDTFLNVLGQYNICKSILKCYESMFSEIVLSYIINHRISVKDLKMAVIIQEMVDAQLSGICFTVNPLTGNDKEILVEIAEGLGDNIVSGKVKPEQYYYNWYDTSLVMNKENKLLNKKQLESIMLTFLDIQLFFGYPCDIEFSIIDDELFILQARGITKIKYSGFKDVWSTADFKDGGVSATVCTPYMWSLYEYIWEYTLRKFVIDSKILKPNDCNKKLGDMFYGRPYWNLSVVKLAMSKIPGYKEREFDSEFGIKQMYEGDGATTGFTLSSLFAIAKMAVAQNKILKTRNQNAKNLIENLLIKYNGYRQSINDITDISSFEKKWYTLTKVDYLDCESTYFWQIFINTIHQSLYKDGLLKYVSESDYLGLLSGIDNISHLVPFYDMWGGTRDIRSNHASFEYWINSSPEKIQKDYNVCKETNLSIEDKPTDKNQLLYLSQVDDFIEKYGYHSNKELDVTYPCYYEDTLSVIKMFKDSVQMDDSCSPVEDKKRQKLEFEKQLNKIKHQVKPNRYTKLETKIKNMRKMLWWREEFRDVSTRFYYIIRIYTMKLADYYVEKGILKHPDDIWMLKLEHIWNYMDQKLSKDELYEIIDKNKHYYHSYRNFMSENEIGSIFDTASLDIIDSEDSIVGLGCNNGIVTATARVIQDLDDIDRLKQGDILITKFTDTGWTCKFAMLSGIVTEFGGILCHAAIVSREYGIPCIVCAHDIMKKIQDGSQVTINGTTGEVTIVDNKLI